ncbi:MAG: hypothetical protein ISS46_02460 [Candidatus Omnitrophica bacterium]|nr:hypothetical protein [Candidatus Omnitrophota bacterium]
MNKIIIFGISLLLSISIPSNLDAGDDTFKTGYVCMDLKGNERWSAVAEIFSCADKGPDIYKLVEKVKGYYSGFKGEISWVETLEFESNKVTVRPLKTNKKIFDEYGKVIALEYQEFDFINKVASYYYEYLPAKRKIEKTFKFKDDIVTRLILGLYVQKFLENGETEKTVELVSSEPQLYKVNIRITGEEKIDINGREKIAYKLCLDPDIGLLNIFKFFISKTYVWHSSVPDFEWLKYRGLENTISSPNVEIRTKDKL